MSFNKHKTHKNSVMIIERIIGKAYKYYKCTVYTTFVYSYTTTKVCLLDIIYCQVYLYLKLF